MPGDPLMRSILLLIFLSLPLLASVVTQKLERGQLSQRQNFNGTLSFNEKARLATESEGLITRLYFLSLFYLLEVKSYLWFIGR